MPHITIPQQAPRERDGKLSPYAWPGGYPIGYITADIATHYPIQGYLCASCADERTAPDSEGDASETLVAFQVLEGTPQDYDNQQVTCEHCNRVLVGWETPTDYGTGTWIDGTLLTDTETNDRIQDLAQSMGWYGEVLHAPTITEEIYSLPDKTTLCYLLDKLTEHHDATLEAINYLESLAPEGYWIGYHPDYPGDFGMWPTTEEEEN